jgi:hypothetical protein
MTFTQRTVLAGLALPLILLSACREAKLVGPPPGHLYGQEQGRKFGVYIYTDSGQCYADSNAVTIWKSKNQTVQWISDDGKSYLVDFTLGQRGSPFGQTTFAVQTNGVTPSGHANPQSSDYYDYGIRAGTAPDSPICKKASDPGVYVK